MYLSPSSLPAPRPALLASVLLAAATMAALPETVVVEDRLPRPGAERAPSVSRIDGAELEEQGRADLASALGELPGVVALPQSGEGSQTSLFLRGTNSTHTALLLDGRRLTPGFSGSYEPGRYRLGGLASVEVRRGAASALYGANALGGVVDLRLRDPLADEEGGAVSADAGSFGRAGLRVSALGRGSPDHGFVGDLALAREDGWRDNADRESLAFLGKDARRLAPGVVADVVVAADNARAGLPGQRTAATPDDPNDWQRDSGWMVSPGLVLGDGKETRGQVFWAHSRSAVTSFVDGANFFGPYLYHQRFELRRDELTALGERRLGAVTLGGGLTYERADYDQQALDPFSTEWADVQEGLGAWVYGELRAGEADRFRLGLRRDRFTDFGGKTTGEVSWTRRLADGLVAQARVATAFRAPSANDQAYGTSGGLPLRPESNRSAELGIRKENEALGGLGWAATLFDNRLEDLIDYDPADSYKTFNIGRATTRGAELEAETRPALGWRIRAALTFLEARADTGDSFGITQPGQRLLRRPDLTAALSVECRPTEATALGAGLVWLRGREDYDFDTGARVDLRDAAQGRLWATHRLDARTRLSLRVENVGGSRAELASLGYPSPPRAVTLGLTREF